MKTLTVKNPVTGRAKLAMLVAVAMPMLAACDGIEAVSKRSEQAAHRLNFKQVAFIGSSSAPGRVLHMHVFQEASGQMPRSSQKVSFHAELKP